MHKLNKQQITLILIGLLIFTILLGGCAQRLGSVEIRLPDAAALAIDLEAAAANVLEYVFDEYATYFSPEQFQRLLESFRGYFAGIGIQMMQDDEGNTIVSSAMPDRPALAAGVEGGDIIVMVDGEIMAGLPINDVLSRIRGEEGTDVEIVFRRQTGDGYYEYTVVITRVIIESTSVRGQLLENYPGIAYIQVYDFTQNTPEEFVNIFNQLHSEHLELHNGQELGGLILDLRSNSGGSFNAAISLAQFFVPDGLPIVWEKIYGDYIYHNSRGGGQLTNLAVVCLQNGFTASASEVFIGALRDHGIAEVVGDTSFGKGVTQVLRDLPHGGGIQYTQSRYFTPNHFDLHNRGLEPDVLICDDYITGLFQEEVLTREEYFNPEAENNVHMREAIALLLQRI